MKLTFLSLTLSTLLLTSNFLLPVFSHAQTQFWGVTSAGGQSGEGVIFKTDGSGNNEIVQQDLVIQNEGANPQYTHLVVASDGELYGMTSKGGVNNAGVIFQYNLATNTYIKKFDFGGVNGSSPNGSLMQANDGKLYGITYSGGANNKGVIFQYDPATSTFTKKFDFDGLQIGSSPSGSLIQASDGKLYGMTYGGGANDLGSIFQYDLSTNTYTRKFDFGITNGKYPKGSLLQASDGKLYGMTSDGGADNAGVIFQYEPATNTYKESQF